MVVEEVGLDENVAFDGATGEVKKKRKKKKKIVGDEIGNGEYGGAVEDEEAEQTVLPYDGENLKKGRKKKKVKEYQVEEVTFHFIQYYNNYYTLIQFFSSNRLLNSRYKVL